MKHSELWSSGAPELRAPEPEPYNHVPSGDSGIDYESIEVPPSPDEPGAGETRERALDAELGMAFGLLEKKPETGLKEPMAVPRREDRREVEEANQEI